MKRKQKYINEMRQRGIKDLLLDVFVVVGLIAIAFSVIQYINYKIDPVHAFILGFKPIHIENDSMEPVIPQNSLVLVRKVNYDALGINDVIAYSINGKDIIIRQVSSVNAAGIRTLAVKDSTYEGDLVLEEHVVGRLAFVWKGYTFFSKKGVFLLLPGLAVLITAAVLIFFKRRNIRKDETAQLDLIETEQSFPDIEAFTPGELQQEEAEIQEAPVVYDFDALLFGLMEKQEQPKYDFDSLLVEKLEGIGENLPQEPNGPATELEAGLEREADTESYYQGLIDLL